MSCGVRRMVLGSRQFLELSPEEYERAKRAREMLLDAVQMEEKLQLVLANYAEFETELARLTMDQLVFEQVSWNSLHDDRHEVARRLVNLLTTGRLYIGQVKHDISGLYGDSSPQFKELDVWFSEEYDSHLGYRAMEALRSFVQHRSMPVHGMSYNRRRQDSKAGDLAEHICTPSLSVGVLRTEGKFKKQVLDELDRIADKDGLVDVKPLVREYVTSIARVQQKLRQRIAADVEAAEREFQDVRGRFQKSFGDNLVGIALVNEDANGIASDPLYLVPDVIDRRKTLVYPFRDYRACYASSEARGDRLR
jgi:hypothetical protein